MKNLKHYLSLTLLICAAYACEPEELPDDLKTPTATGETLPNPPEDEDSGAVEDTGDDEDDIGGGH